MKEFKEDKKELEDKIIKLVDEFNKKYDVVIGHIDIAYDYITLDTKYGKIVVNVDIKI